MSSDGQDRDGVANSVSRLLLVRGVRGWMGVSDDGIVRDCYVLLAYCDKSRDECDKKRTRGSQNKL